MIRPIMRNELVLQRASAPATEADLPIAQDLLDTLEAHRHSCVGMYEAEEGCLSLSGTRSATRYRTIKVSYQDLAMKPRVKTFTGFTAQIIQHEIDHCNGVLI